MTAHVMTPTVCVLAEHRRQPSMAGPKTRFSAWGGGSPMRIRNMYGLQNQVGGRGTVNREIRLAHSNQALIALVWTLRALGPCEDRLLPFFIFFLQGTRSARSQEDAWLASPYGQEETKSHGGIFLITNTQLFTVFTLRRWKLARQSSF